jgi:predicted Zn-dependent peptidase
VRPSPPALSTPLLLGLALAIGLSGASQAGDLPVWGYLDNGMGYLLLESHAAPLTGSSVIVHSGSARESFSTSGASHFLEHLLFNGTETRTQEQLYDDVDAIGGYNNATTRRTHVAYMMLTPAEKIRTGLEIQADMLFHSTLPPEKLEKERGIILEELAKDRDQSSFELERILGLAAFGPEGPGLPVMGSALSIETIDRETILGFYKGLYTPQNMTLLVVGDFESAEMELMIGEVFGHEPAGPSPPETDYPDLEWDGRPIISRHTGSSIVLEWTSPGPDPASGDFLAYECLVELALGGDASPANRALRERFVGKILSSSGWIEMIPGGSFLRYRVEADGSADWREIAAAVPEILRSRAIVPGIEEIEAWKTARETDEFFLREKPHFYAIYRGERIAAQGIEGILTLPHHLAELSSRDLDHVALGIDGETYRLAVVLPEAAPEAAEEGAPGGTMRRSTLENGTELLILSSPESPVLALHLFVRGRAEAEPAEMDGAVELLHRLMTVRTSLSDPQTLQQKIRSIGAQLKAADNPFIPYDDFYTTHSHSYVRLQSLDRFADEAFALLAELLGPPGWTDVDFEETRATMLASAQRSSASSRTIARRLVRNALYKGSLRSREVFGKPESLERMTADSLRSLSRQYLVGKRLLLVVATALPPETIEEIASRHLAALPSGVSSPPLEDRKGILERIRTELANTDPVPEEIPALTPPDSTWLTLEAMGARQARITWVRPLGFVEDEEFEAVKVWNGLLSNEVQFQLREREGLAYSIGTSVDRLDDGTVLWTASAGSGKENLGRILEGFQQILTASLQAAPDSSDVARQGVQIYGRSLMRRATRMNRAYAAGMAILEGRDPEAIDEEIRAPMRVTAEEIAALLPKLRDDLPGLVAIAY